MGDRLIPRPKKIKHLQGVMRLEGDNKSYLKFRKNVENLMRQHLNRHETWCNQSKESKTRFLQAAVREIKVLERFETPWPVEFFATQRLYIWRRSLRISKAKARAREKREHIHQTSEQGANVTSRKRPVKDGLTSKLMKDPSSDVSSGTKMKTEPAVRPCLTVMAFLSRCRLSSLLRAFLNAGIYNQDHLEGLAEMPVLDQELLLKGDIGITCFEFRKIRVALDSLLLEKSDRSPSRTSEDKMNQV